MKVLRIPCIVHLRTGVLSDDRMKLDYVLGLKIEDFLERRLQTQVLNFFSL